MKQLVLATVVPVALAFGAGIAVGPALMPISNASTQAKESSFSPEALQRGIDARTLPLTEVRDFD